MKGIKFIFWDFDFIHKIIKNRKISWQPILVGGMGCVLLLLLDNYYDLGDDKTREVDYLSFRLLWIYLSVLFFLVNIKRIDQYFILGFPIGIFTIVSRSAGLLVLYNLLMFLIQLLLVYVTNVKVSSFDRIDESAIFIFPVFMYLQLIYLFCCIKKAFR